MTPLDALLIGMLQGITEFLPISSSTHLKLAKLFLHIPEGEEQLVFDLVCHLGTLCAALFFFKKEIFNLFTKNRPTLFLLLVATLPLVPLYFLLKPLRAAASHQMFLGYFLLLTSFILFVGQRVRFKLAPTHSKLDALWIGMMQAAALIPGISRSASTIACAQVLGWDSKSAVRFSFLLAIPTIVGGNLLETLKLTLSAEPAPSISFSSCLIGFLSSLGIGMWAIRYAIRFLEKGNLKPFAWYCLALGIATIFYMNMYG